MDDRPIGFFDSGLGGVSVLRETVRLLPYENFIYYGDDANAPYGLRPEDEIRTLTLAAADRLIDQDVKLIVVACNTATSVAIDDMRDLYDVPIVSMEPAIKPAADAYPTVGTIAVMATPATLHQRRFLSLVRRLGLEHRVKGVPCPDLAGLIETGDLRSPSLHAYISDRVSTLKDDDDVCAIVVGCTHYTFVSDLIYQEAAAQLRGACGIFDGAGGTSRRVRNIITEKDMLAENKTPGRVTFCSSGGPLMVKRMERFFCLPLTQRRGALKDAE